MRWYFWIWEKRTNGLFCTLADFQTINTNPAKWIPIRKLLNRLHKIIVDADAAWNQLNFPNIFMTSVDKFYHFIRDGYWLSIGIAIDFMLLVMIISTHFHFFDWSFFIAPDGDFREHDGRGEQYYVVVLPRMFRFYWVHIHFMFFLDLIAFVKPQLLSYHHRMPVICENLCKMSWKWHNTFMS